MKKHPFFHTNRLQEMKSSPPNPSCQKFSRPFPPPLFPSSPRAFQLFRGGLFHGVKLTIKISSLPPESPALPPFPSLSLLSPFGMFPARDDPFTHGGYVVRDANRGFLKNEMPRFPSSFSFLVSPQPRTRSRRNPFPLPAGTPSARTPSFLRFAKGPLSLLS